MIAIASKRYEDVDVYVLMVGTFPTYSWIGWATAQELLIEDNLVDLGYGPTYALEQAALHPPLLSMIVTGLND